MNALTIPGASADTLTMSSLEIAKLVEQRHDNVKRTIETLGAKGLSHSLKLRKSKSSASDGPKR